MGQPAELTEKARQFALQRFRLLQPHLEQHRALRLVAAEAKIPFRTAQRWVAQYQKFGLAALARKKRADCGNQRTISIRLKEVIEGLALQRPALPISVIQRQVLRLAKNLGEEPPGYWPVYRIVRGLPADLLTLAHEGTKAYSEEFELVVRREADGRTPFGRRTILRSISCSSSRTGKWPNHGLRRLSTTTAGRSQDIFFRSRTHRHYTRRWLCGRQSGGKRIRAGSPAGYRMSSIPTTGATSTRAIWSRWEPT